MNPFDYGSSVYTNIMKTRALQALEKWGFDAAFGGARRDEEKSREGAVYSFGTATTSGTRKNQRPELWNPVQRAHPQGRVDPQLPLSNWTELDTWLYIHREGFPVVPLYFAKERPTSSATAT